MEVIENEATGLMAELFVYFDSDPEHPLTPRELLQYWHHLTEIERLEHMLMFE